MSEIQKCESCGCEGNQSCTYPPKDEATDCSLKSCHDLVCGCCVKGINRMNYRPQEDGQEILPL